jgi:hypothetical protein
MFGARRHWAGVRERPFQKPRETPVEVGYDQVKKVAYNRFAWEALTRTCLR